MKSAILVILAAALFVFWPEDTEPSTSLAAKEKPVISQRSSIERAHSRRHSSARDLTQSDTRDLQNQIWRQWPAITSELPARDPRVVQFIRTLRELGKRDGPGTLAFLDQLSSQDKEAEWIQARVAVAGGWALSDPKAAGRALLDEKKIQPAPYQNPKLDSALGSLHPAHDAITRAVQQIFELWAEVAPDHFNEAAENVVVNGSMWNFIIKSQLSAMTHRGDGSSANAFATRNSIDAILNNPDRTISGLHVSAPLPLTKAMNKLGEPAFSREEWAARNPEHALAMIEESRSRNEPILPSLITGMARNNSNYVDLLALAPAEQRIALAKNLISLTQEHAHETVWILDGRETTWQLDKEEREASAMELLQSGILSDEELQSIIPAITSMPLPDAFDLPSTGVVLEVETLPELPNKMATPTE